MKTKGVNLDSELVRTAMFMPAGFTGRWRDGKYYYKGHEWRGATNRVGQKDLRKQYL